MKKKILTNLKIYLLLAFFLFITFFSIGQKNLDEPAFKTKIFSSVEIQNGISQNRILSIFKDSKGFMWFGTGNGLNRYDGYEFKTINYDGSDETLISQNDICSIIEDKNNYLWISCVDGLCKIDPFTFRISSFAESDTTYIRKGANNISNLAQDADGTIWYGTKGAGLVSFNVDSEEREYHLENMDTKDKQHLTTIPLVYRDSKKHLWLGNIVNNSIPVYHNETEKVNYIPIDRPTNVVYNNTVQSFHEDASGRIWFCFLADYLSQEKLHDYGIIYYLDPNDTIFRSLRVLNPTQYDPYSIWFNSVTTITSDSSNIWFGSINGGIIKVDKALNTTLYYKNDPYADPGILSLLIDENNMMWIGTNGYGVQMLPFGIENFKNVEFPYSQNKFSLSARAIMEDEHHFWFAGYFGIMKTDKYLKNATIVNTQCTYTLGENIKKKSHLWAGNEGFGLEDFNKNNHKLAIIPIKKQHPETSTNKVVYKTLAVNDTLLLVGGLFGLTSYNAKTNTFYPITVSSHNSQMRNVVISINQLYDGEILIGCKSGKIFRYYPETNTVESFHIHHKFSLCPTANITCIYKDEHSTYWMSTSSGLLKYNQSDNIYKVYSMKDGLPNNYLYAVLPDEVGNLWISSNLGISCFNPTNEQFRNFNANDGLQANEFNRGAFYKSNENTLFFGGIHGITYFRPNDILENTIIPTIALTSLKVGNSERVLDHNFYQDQTITLHPEEDNFTISFAGLNYLHANNNMYQYRIKEISKEWIDLGKKRYITFHQFNSGTYTLEILTVNSHGKELVKPYTVKLVLLPYFYESKIFKFLLIILFISTFIGLYYFRVNYYNIQKKKLTDYANKQTFQLKQTNNKLLQSTKSLEKNVEELNSILSILSHDIINPVSSIQGLSELVENATKYNIPEEQQKEILKTIHSSSSQIIDIIKNTLAWSKLKREKYIPTFKKLNLEQLSNESISLLKGSAFQKNITITNTIPKQTFVNADANMVDIIIRNICSNAVKFTPQNGYIKIEAAIDEHFTTISIEDNGVGIPKEMQNDILNMSKTVSTHGTNMEKGIGLGTSVITKFVYLNKGKVWFESEEGKGTCFYFTLMNE